MPIDSSIPLGVRPLRLPDMGQVFQQAQQMRIQRETADAIAEQRKAQTEQTRIATEAAQRAQAESEALNTLFASGQPVAPPDIYKIVGPKRGADILKGILDLQSANLKSDDDVRASLTRRVAAIAAWPEPGRQAAYERAAADYVQRGLMKPEDIPPYSPEVLQHYATSLLTPDKQYDLAHPKPIEHDPTHALINPQTGVEIVPAKPKELSKPSSAQEFEYRNSLPPDQRAAFDKYQTEDANRRRPVTNIHAGGVPASGGLETDTVDYEAAKYRILGAQSIPTRVGEADRIKIMNAAAKQSQALGRSPVDAVLKQAAFKSDASSLTKITAMKSAAEAYESKAMAQSDLVLSLSEKVNRSSIPAINGAILSGKINLAGDEQAQLYANALTTFGEEYAKIMAGATGSAAAATDSARKTAHDLIRVGLTKGQIKSTIQQMQWEMRQTLLGYDATINHITERMQGGAPQVPQVAASGQPAEQRPIPGIPGGIAELRNGKWIRIK